MAYLHSDREQFRDAIDLAYEQTGVMVQAIEKDYYVTMLLRLLAQKISIVRPQYNADRLWHERIKSSYAGIVCETKESADGQQSYYCPG